MPCSLVALTGSAVAVDVASCSTDALKNGPLLYYFHSLFSACVRARRVLFLVLLLFLLAFVFPPSFIPFPSLLLFFLPKRTEEEEEKKKTKGDIGPAAFCSRFHQGSAARAHTHTHTYTRPCGYYSTLDESSSHSSSSSPSSSSFFRFSLIKIRSFVPLLAHCVPIRRTARIVCFVNDRKKEKRRRRFISTEIFLVD